MPNKPKIPKHDWLPCDLPVDDGKDKAAQSLGRREARLAPRASAAGKDLRLRRRRPPRVGRGIAAERMGAFSPASAEIHED